MAVMIEDLMSQLVTDGGSDLHLSAGLPPYGRFNGQLRPINEERLNEETCNKLIFSMLNNAQRKQLEQTWELDCSYGLKGVARFRVNVYRQRGTYAACLRALGNSIPDMETLGLPPIVEEISRSPKGLVLVTGPTGSGKTTTLAAILDHINKNRAEHILTIEDPIEFTYRSVKSVVHQRQLNDDTRSFANALRAALREDPDVILVGEMRDLETIQLAITAAETGHLVFGTLHTNSAVKTVERVLGMFPPNEQDSVRRAVSETLLGVISQGLLKTTDGKRCAFHDILINTDACKDYILKGDLDEIEDIMGRSAFDGMQTSNQALLKLVEDGRVEAEDALAQSLKPNELEQALRGRT